MRKTWAIRVKKGKIIQLSMIAHARQDQSENKRGYMSVGIECK